MSYWLNIFFLPADSRIWQPLSGHEWHHPPVLSPKWRRCPFSHLRGEDLCGHFPLPGGTVSDHQATQGLLHGCGWCGTKGKDEPAERTQIQVEMDEVNACNLYIFVVFLFFFVLFVFFLFWYKYRLFSVHLTWIRLKMNYSSLNRTITACTLKMKSI